MVRQVNLYEAKTHLSKLVEAAARGEVIVIAKNGKPLAKLSSAPDESQAPRELGQWAALKDPSDSRTRQEWWRDWKALDAEIEREFEQGVAEDRREYDNSWPATSSNSSTFIWAKEEPQRLRREAYFQLKAPENRLFVSVASLWELGIKASKGKLPTYAHMLVHGPDALERSLSELRFELMQIGLDHVVAAYNLPRHHNDPFDRLLIAQALSENIAVITSDDAFTRYAGLRVLVALSGEAAELADVFPFRGRHRLNREARDFTSTMSFSVGSALHCASVTGLRQVAHRLHIHQAEAAGLVGWIFAVFADHLDDADDPLLVAGVIEEAEIALLHRLHVARSLPVAHAAPRLAFGAALLLHLPRKRFGFGLEQPIGHAALRVQNSAPMGLKVGFHGRTSECANSPAFT